MPERWNNRGGSERPQQYDRSAPHYGGRQGPGTVGRAQNYAGMHGLRSGDFNHLAGLLSAGIAQDPRAYFTERDFMTRMPHAEMKMLGGMGPMQYARMFPNRRMFTHSSMWRNLNPDWTHQGGNSIRDIGGSWRQPMPTGPATIFPGTMMEMGAGFPGGPPISGRGEGSPEDRLQAFMDALANEMPGWSPGGAGSSLTEPLPGLRYQNVR